MANWGMKISLPGYDAKTATPEQCVLHSEYACPKIKLNQNPPHFGIYQYTFTSNPGVGDTILTTIHHGFNYRPMHLVCIKYVDINSINRAQPLPAEYDADTLIDSYTTASDLVIVLSRIGTTNNLIGKTWTFKYYIFVEDGA